MVRRIVAAGADSPPQNSEARCPVPPPVVRPARHTATVTIRYSVQADTHEECMQGLERLVAIGLVPIMLPKQVLEDRWMARAVPPPTVKPPADNGRGPTAP
jgi:hypothetical protein